MARHSRRPHSSETVFQRKDGSNGNTVRTGIRSERNDGGGGGIRTHGTRKGTTVFETAPFDHSGTPPLGSDGRAFNMGHVAAKQAAMMDNGTRQGRFRPATELSRRPRRGVDIPRRPAYIRAVRAGGFAARPCFIFAAEPACASCLWGCGRGIRRPAQNMDRKTCMQ